MSSRASASSHSDEPASIAALLTAKDALYPLLRSSALPVPLSFSLGNEEEAFRAVAAQAPRRWVQRPNHTTPGFLGLALEDPSLAERSGRWVAQEAVSSGRDETVHGHVAIRSLDPVVADAAVDAEAGSELAAELHRLCAAFVAALRRPLRLRPLHLPLVVTIAFLVDGSGRPWFLEADVPADAPERDWRRVPSGDEPTATLPVHADGARAASVEPGLAVLLPAEGELAVLGELGAYVWAAVGDGLRLDEMAAELAGVVGEQPEDARRRVEAAVAELLEHRILRPSGAAPGSAPRPWTPPRGAMRSAVPEHGAGRTYRVGGCTVAVRFPGPRDAVLADRALHPSAEVATEAEGTVVVTRERGKWLVAGTHVAPDWCPTGYQLGPLVRDAVVRTVARAGDGPLLRGSIVGRGGNAAAVLVVGHPVDRARLLDACLEAGYACHADALVELPDAGAPPESAVGILRRADYQWLDGPPLPVGDPAAPLVDSAGELVELWTAAVRASLPTPRLLLVLGDATEGSPTEPISREEALRVVLSARVVPTDPVGVGEAARLVHWVNRLDCRRGGGRAVDLVQALDRLLGGAS